ncbi:glutamate--cysteine ligase [Diplodia intermedia]|uniref:Glutamate--cysteine ligase n=1 Tax=Diplodia intermedia TaxID=856260 RepID=A0ABR3TNM8_9PEZI
MSRSSKPNLLQIEYALLALDEDAKTANHCLRAPELLNKLQKITAAGTYSPEIAQFQIESQPPVPYTDSVESLLSVEKDMANRRTSRDRHENFECLTGAAYPSVKLKHPSPDDAALGWRVEFRSMENSLTDFENAAFVVFVALVRRAVDGRRSGSGGGVNWYVPMEQVWENMERAHARDAVRWQRFWWKAEGGGDESALLTVDEIVNGCAAFGGLMGLVEGYMADEGFSVAEREKLQPYLDLVRGRASGRLCTTARFMRDFVTRHPEYARDSQVSEKICFDLVQEVVQITNGKRDCGLFQSL